MTSPANCPHAAAISSPRVFLTVVTIFASCNIEANCSTRCLDDLRNQDPGNGLNGIKFNLQRIGFNKVINSLACASESLTPSSMQYSNVKKSLGANGK